MTVDFTEFLDMTAEELYEDWLNFITARDPLLQDTSVATFNSILAEAVASEFWIVEANTQCWTNCGECDTASTVGRWN